MNLGLGQMFFNALSLVLYAFWAVMFVSLFFGYEPSRILIGCAFLISAIDMIRNANDN